MKLFTTFILVLLVSIQVFSKWLILAEYAVNKEFIAKNLCINKEKPQLKCHGKCQLMKKMAEETENSNSGKENGSVKMSFPEVLPIDEFFSFRLTAPFSESISHNALYILKTYKAPLPCVFHPPLA